MNSSRSDRVIAQYWVCSITITEHIALAGSKRSTSPTHSPTPNRAKKHFAIGVATNGVKHAANYEEKFSVRFSLRN